MKNFDYESIVLETLYSCGGASVKTILRQSGLAKKHEDKLKAAVNHLIAKKMVSRGKNDRLYISETQKIFTGTVASLSRTYGFITNPQTGEDCFVKGGELKGAVPGDTVLARELSEKSQSRSATAEVVAVLEYSDKLFGGVVVRDGNAFRVLPDTLGCPPLEIMKVRDQIRAGDKVLFSIRKRGAHHSEHIVDIEEAYGSCDKASACTEAYLAQNGIPTAFSAEAAQQAASISELGIGKDFDKRLDLRDMPIFTIDGADTKDIDDAISIEKTDNGYLLGVHIADVSHYVKDGTPLDADAFSRGTSVYIADKVIPMLPKELSNGVCSLNPNEDRLAFSCLMELSKDGKLDKFKFKKTVIRSRVKGVYSEINAIYADEADETIKEKYKEVAAALPIMKELADILMTNRKKRGAPEISSTESKIICDENGICVDVKERVQGISENIIEEFMLSANNAAARLAMKNGLPFVYRIHENPADDKIEMLKESLAALGIEPLGINQKAQAAVFAALLEKAKDDPRFPIINRLVLRTMAKAKYSEQPVGHFGLVMAEYAHFTSPIRRYSDLAVHRILSEYIENTSDKAAKKYTSFAQKAAAQATGTEIRAVNAERSCEDYYTAEYMQNHIGEEYEGMISGVISTGFFVQLANTVEGKVDIGTLPADAYEVRDGITLLALGAADSYTVGDRVRVRCTAANVNIGKIDFELVSGQ
ncbi:MAG: ribonuclease R [Eubacterium sp.]|nr:ribonuclease R [Eubacterium sp.]